MHCMFMKGNHSCMYLQHIITSPHPASPAPRSTSQHHATPRSTTQHHAAPRSTTQHHAASRSITQHHAASRSISQHPPSITQHSNSFTRPFFGQFIVIFDTLSADGSFLLQHFLNINYFIFSPFSTPSSSPRSPLRSPLLHLLLALL